MTVFIVNVHDFDVTETMGVFSTRENAEAFVATLDEIERINAEISAWVVV